MSKFSVIYSYKVNPAYFISEKNTAKSCFRPFFQVFDHSNVELGHQCVASRSLTDWKPQKSIETIKILHSKSISDCDNCHILKIVKITGKKL